MNDKKIVIISGPPGCGKTSFHKYLSNEVLTPFSVDTDEYGMGIGIKHEMHLYDCPHCKNNYCTTKFLFGEDRKQDPYWKWIVPPRVYTKLFEQRIKIFCGNADNMVDIVNYLKSKNIMVTLFWIDINIMIQMKRLKDRVNNNFGNKPEERYKAALCVRNPELPYIILNYEISPLSIKEIVFRYI